ncbi:hypothetical protein BT69DRAFT_1198386, partial [Atractiella rhizophila]
PGFQHAHPPQEPHSQNPMNAKWQYRDPKGQVQGPFSATQMQDWYSRSYFPDDLLVKRLGEDSDFVRLVDFIARVGIDEEPFFKQVPPI